MLISMSFICDTGASRHMYLSDQAYNLLSSEGRIKQDDLGTKYAQIQMNGITKNVAVLSTPDVYQPANLLGLPILILFGMSLGNEIPFGFSDFPDFF